MPETYVRLSETLDFNQVILKRIDACGNAKSVEEYASSVEKLTDTMVPWWDEKFIEELKNKQLKPDLSNPYFNSIPDEKKMDYARSLYRSVMKLIQRSGFLPEKSIDGVLDEKTVDAIMEATS